MKRQRKVYLVIGHCLNTKTTYVSEVCSSKKKAEVHMQWISALMSKEEDQNRVYWVHDARVA